MANADNSCAHLEVEDVFNESKNTLADLYNLQKDIQENVYGYNFEDLREKPLNEFRQFFDWNYHAIQDELRETFDALGGIKDGIGNGVWKPWKKVYHEKAPSMTFNSLTEDDKKELQMDDDDEVPTDEPKVRPQSKVQDFVKNLSGKQYKEFAFDNDIDHRDPMEMQDFIQSLSDEEAEEILKKYGKNESTKLTSMIKR